MTRPSPRSVIVGGRHTSVSVEDDFWRGLREMARARRATTQEMIEEIASRPSCTNLSAAIRLTVFRYFRKLTLDTPEMRK